MSLTCQQAQYGPMEKASGPVPSSKYFSTYLDPQLRAPSPGPHWREPSIRMLNSDKDVLLVGGLSFWYEDPPRRLLLQCWLQLSGTIPAMHEFSYAARSSPCLKCYNAPTSMRTVMDSDRYLCMTISTIKWRDPVQLCRFKTSAPSMATLTGI